MQCMGSVIRRNLTLPAVLRWKFLFSQQCIQHPKVHLPTDLNFLSPNVKLLYMHGVQILCRSYYTVPCNIFF